MQSELINLEKFFNDKYRNINGVGIGAVSIITQYQTVTRYTESGIDQISKRMVKGCGRHETTKNLILQDIFELPQGIAERFQPQYYKALQKMSAEEARIKDEVVEIDYINSSSGNIIIIKIPTYQKSITTRQLLEIANILEQAEQVSCILTQPIKIWVGIKNKTLVLEKINKNKVILFLKKFIDDSYTQTIKDINILSFKDKKEERIR